MSNDSNKNSRQRSAKERFHDRVMSLLLAMIWIVAALFVRRSTPEIPNSILIIATVFFIMLIPAMKELVRVIDRRVRIELGLTEPADD